MLSQEDLKQIAQKGITQEQSENQLSLKPASHS